MSESLTEHFERFKKRILNPSFINECRTAGEVKYYIFNYNAKDELSVRKLIKNLAENYKDSRPEYSRVVVFDIYTILTTLLKDQKYLDKVFANEERKSFEKIQNDIENFLSLTEEGENEIVEYIRQNTPENCVVVLYGVGKCYPILSTHLILNQLHQTFNSQPVILFYPGEYNEKFICEFGTVKTENYYRAYII